jgi:protein phosphatase
MTQLNTPSLHQLSMGQACGITDRGTVRPTNQDNFLVAPTLGLLAVADGMGGHAGGELASSEALRLLANHLHQLPPLPPDVDATWTGAGSRALHALRDAISYANGRLYQANSAAGLGDGLGMGTTLTGMWHPDADGPAHIFHVGDSRIYRLRDGMLAQLTHDQTWYQQALESGVRHNLPPRNLLLQALGPADVLRPDVFSQPLAAGDIYMLCSDGLYGASEMDAIRALLAQVADDNLVQVCHELVEMAKRDGSRDNITAVLLRCPS